MSVGKGDRYRKINTNKYNKNFDKINWESEPMICDTCGKEVDEVKRVVVYKGYDRSLSKPIYNCEECYNVKEKNKNYSN